MVIQGQKRACFFYNGWSLQEDHLVRSLLAEAHLPRLQCLSFRTLKMDERASRMGERRRLLEEEMYLEEEDEELWFCCGLHRIEGPSYYDITTVFLWIFSAFCLYLIFRAIFATQKIEQM